MRKKLSCLTALFVFLAVFVSVSPSVHASTSKVVQIKDSWTYINAKPDPKSRRLGKAYRNHTYTYVKWTKGRGYAKGAYGIKVGRSTGYVSAKSSKLISTSIKSTSTKSKPASKPKSSSKSNNKFTVNTSSTVKLNVKPISQRPELPTGCEITAFTMMVNHAGGRGAHVTKMQMAREMPRSKDPNKGFIGSPYNSSGVAIYPPGLRKMDIKYTGSYKNMTGSSINQIKAQLKRGRVVCMWGRFVFWHINMSHTVALTGYDKSGFFYNDPMDGKAKHMTYGSMWSHYIQLGKRALSY